MTGSGVTGGELRFPMVADQPPLLVRVEEATRPAVVRWTVLECTFMQDWVRTQPTVTITALDDGSCELTFEHRGLNDELKCKDMCSRSWDHIIGTSLRELAEGGPGAPNRSPEDLARRVVEENALFRGPPGTARASPGRRRGRGSFASNHPDPRSG